MPDGPDEVEIDLRLEEVEIILAQVDPLDPLGPGVPGDEFVGLLKTADFGFDDVGLRGQGRRAPLGVVLEPVVLGRD